MNDPRRAAPGRFGLTDQRAEQELTASGWWGPAGRTEGSEPVLGALSRTPDPNLALHALARLRTADNREWPEIAARLLDDPVFRARLIAVLGTSDALGDYLMANPTQ